MEQTWLGNIIGYTLLALIIGGFPALCAFGAYMIGAYMRFSWKGVVSGLFLLLVGFGWAWFSYQFMFNVKIR
jgi:hypothetical protein